MSKPHPANRHHHRRKEPLPEKIESGTRIPGTLLVCLAAIVLAGVPFALGKYFEFNSPCAFDGGGYVYSAKHILEGAEIGVEEKPSAQLGTLLLNMLGVKLFGFNDTGPKLIQAIFQAAALILMFITMWKLFGRLAAILTVVVASSYLSAPFMAKYGNVKEQYMIAFMILGVCSYVMYQLNGRRLWAMLAGAFLIWAPLFKATGLSAIGAIGLFVVLQPLFKHRTWRQMLSDVLWLFVGAAAAIAPAYIWMIGWHIQMALPYQVIWDTLAKHLVSSSEVQQAQSPDYVSMSYKMIAFSEVKARVLRYYGVLILPVALAILACVARVIRSILTYTSKRKLETKPYERFVLLFAIWWILDMIFVWISPRSYEQYYLPLNASAAMLGGYLVALYSDKFTKAENKPMWAAIGFLCLLLMVVLSAHIFIGINKSAHSGQQYKDRNGNPIRAKGYVQKYRDVSLRRKNANYKGPWEQVGLYIRQNSTESDGIYVWGWVPGIYVVAQRMSPAPKAFEGTMHTLTPPQLTERVTEILDGFKKQPPKFIVDTHKLHFPWNRPPLELWPRVQKNTPFANEQGFLRNNESFVTQFDTFYTQRLSQQIDPDEARRYEAMKPFRQYVMNNYRIVGAFGEHVLFQRK